MTAIAAIGSVSVVNAADDGTFLWIGFRNDGTGVWPADCAPVTQDSLELLELTTGKTLSKIEKLPIGIHHFSSIAGGCLFGFDGAGGRCVVVEAGKDMKLVGVNGLGERPYANYDFNQGGQPFFSGNRLFYRSYTDVYCIGNPVEPMRLSKGHL